LIGATIKDMAKDLISKGLGDRDKDTTIKRIRTHISHLTNTHKLTLNKENSFIKFDL
jgi:predicted transcriptional regulator